MFAHIFKLSFIFAWALVSARHKCFVQLEVILEKEMLCTIELTEMALYKFCIIIIIIIIIMVINALEISKYM